jgi:hypothetical protein
MFVLIGGKPMYLWRAVDAEGEVLDVRVQPKQVRIPTKPETSFDLKPDQLLPGG